MNFSSEICYSSGRIHTVDFRREATKQMIKVSITYERLAFSYDPTVDYAGGKRIDFGTMDKRMALWWGDKTGRFLTLGNITTHF